MTKEKAVVYAYDAADQMTTNAATNQGVDAAGQLTTAVTGTTSTAYVFEARGNPTKASTGTTVTNYDTAQGMPLILNDGASSYLYGPGGVPFEQITTARVATYLHPDQLGSIRMITNTTGTNAGTANYTAYGTRTTTGTTSAFGGHRPVHRHRNRPAMASRPLLRPHHRPIPDRRPPRRRHRRPLLLRQRQPHLPLRSHGPRQLVVRDGRVGSSGLPQQQVIHQWRWIYGPGENMAMALTWPSVSTPRPKWVSSLVRARFQSGDTESGGANRGWFAASDKEPALGRELSPGRSRSSQPVLTIGTRQPIGIPRLSASTFSREVNRWT